MWVVDILHNVDTESVVKDALKTGNVVLPNAPTMVMLLLVLVPTVVLADTETEYARLGLRPSNTALVALCSADTDNIPSCLFFVRVVGSAVTVYLVMNPRASSKLSGCQLTVI